MKKENIIWYDRKRLWCGLPEGDARGQRHAEADLDAFEGHEN